VKLPFHLPAQSLAPALAIYQAMSQLPNRQKRRPAPAEPPTTPSSGPT